MTIDVLLTGAGFTASAGGYLAQEMWSKLFNSPSVRSSRELTNKLKDEKLNFNYEKVYHELAIEQMGSPEDASLIKTALIEAYRDLNTEIQDLRRILNRLNPVQLLAFIKTFTGDHDSPGYFFTTNQDIFTENLCWRGHHAPWHHIWLPGLPEYPYGKKEMKIPSDEASLQAAPSINPPEGSPALNYIKLHGGFGWKHESTGRDYMVIGINKKELIEKEPLLRYYYETFQKVLQKPETRLFVVGYGFHDQHINNAIMKGIEKNLLEVVIIDPLNPDEFFKRFVHPKGPRRTTINNKKLWDEGITSYFPYSLQELFPHSKDHAILSSGARDLNRIIQFSGNIGHMTQIIKTDQVYWADNI